MEKQNSGIVFFRVLGVSIVVNAIKLDVRNMHAIELLNIIFLNTTLTFVLAVPISVAALFGNEIYHYLKPKVKGFLSKKLKKNSNERCTYLWGSGSRLIFDQNIFRATFGV